MTMLRLRPYVSRSVCATAFGLAIALVPVTARAQAGPSSTAEVRSSAKVHFGPIYASPRLTLKELGVDSNVFNKTGEQSPDFTAVLVPGGTAWVPFARRVLVTADANVDLTYFRKYADQRSADPQMSVGGQIFLRRLTLSAKAGYGRVRQRSDNDLDARVRRTTGSLTAGLEYQATSKLVVSLSTTGTELTVSDSLVFNGVNLRDSLNTTTQSVSGGLLYTATPFTTFVFNVDRERSRFPFAEAKNADSLRIAPGVRFKPRALIAGDAALGFRRFEPKSPLIKPYRGPVASLNLSYNFRGATRFSVGLFRDTAFSYEPVNPYYVSTDIGAGIRRQLAGRYDATFDVKRSSAAYRQQAAVVSALERVDVTRTIGGSVGYRLSKDARIGVGVSYWKRSSNTRSDREYAGIRAGVLFSYGL